MVLNCRPQLLILRSWTRKNGKNLLMDTINRKMITLKVAFDTLEDGFNVTVCCKKVSGHSIVDVRMTLERKDQ